MKQLYLALLALLVCGQSLYGMKRVRPYGAVKNRIFSQLDNGSFDSAYRTYKMYKGVFPHLSFSKEEKSKVRTSLTQEIRATNEELINDSFSITRSNWWWLLPTSATIIATAQAPLLIGLGVIGTTLGSFGFKKQCDALANSMIYKQLCAKADTIEKIFTKKESQIK